MHIFKHKIKNIQVQLKQWNKDIFGNIFQYKHDLYNKMEDIQPRKIGDGRTTALEEVESNIQIEIDDNYLETNIPNPMA